jgi:SpoVK/Ycf46/Vps4 family AAA+-type ATPase
VADSRRWLASERWYKERRIAWRRGYLFYGLPGTGKTSLARAIAIDLDLPVFVLELPAMDDADLYDAFRQAKAHAPAMVVIEDVDTTFRGRENVAGENGGGLNFGTLLQCLGGVEGAEGILAVVTTNHADRLDPALGAPDPATRESTRPGRVDLAVEMGEMTEECRRRVAARVLVDCPDLVAAAVAAGAGETGAQFQHRCCELALARHWAAGGKPP